VSTRIVALGDLHAGHRAGLTPPAWQTHKWRKLQRELWGAYEEIVERIGPPIDLLIANGDLIDGRGERSGGTELITSDLNAQVEMAVEALKVWEAKKIVISYGTSYHVGRLVDFEQQIAWLLGAEIHSHPFIKVEDVVFDVKHKVGRSSIPHGRGTPLARERLWNVLWAEREAQPKADILLRSHTHYFTYIGEADWLAMILPALQAAKTKYGARECSNTVDWGLVEFRVEGGAFTWKAHIKRLKTTKTKIIQV